MSDDQPRREGRGRRSGGRPRDGGRRQGGTDRRGRGGDAAQPPPRRGGARRPPRPALPADPPHLRREVRADIRATAPAAVADDVARAIGAAGDALAQGDVGRAVELLTWAKAVAPRSGAVREALGVAAYQAGDFEQAHRELLAYRRLTDRHDQNHLLADSARALGRYDKVGEYVREMAGAARVSAERLVEAYIVQAGAWADRGDLQGALGILERLELDPDEVRPWHPRVWYAAADLCERLGYVDRARDYFEAITAVADEFLDVDERLAALEL